MIEKNEFIVKCAGLIDKLNTKHNKNVNITFDDDNEWFTYNPQSDCINCNPKILDDSEFQTFYDDHYIHAVLHEYGHAFYYEQICEQVLYFLNDQVFINTYNVEKINGLIEGIRKQGFDISNYWNLLNNSCGEFFADYFVIKEHAEYTTQNISNFLKWRVEKVYIAFHDIKNWCVGGNLYLQYPDHNIYFPIPFLLNNILSSSFNDLFKLWMNEYQNFLKMFYNQVYFKTDFLNQEKKLLQNLNY